MDCESQYETFCREQFQVVHHKLDRLDAAIRGNGNPGILVRLDRLEAVETFRSKVRWIIFGALLTGAGTLIASIF